MILFLVLMMAANPWLGHIRAVKSWILVFLSVISIIWGGASTWKNDMIGEMSSILSCVCFVDCEIQKSNNFLFLKLTSKSYKYFRTWRKRISLNLIVSSLVSLRKNNLLAYQTAAAPLNRIQHLKSLGGTATQDFGLIFDRMLLWCRFSYIGGFFYLWVELMAIFYFPFWCSLLIKNARREYTFSSKTQVFTKSMNMGIWDIVTLIIYNSFFTEIKFSKK